MALCQSLAHGRVSLVPLALAEGKMSVLKAMSFGFVLAVVAGQMVYAIEAGNWTVGNDGKDIMYASTMNDSGHEFGQACNITEGSCFWFVGLDTSCKKGNKYPVLANSDAGSVALQVQCYGPSSVNDYTYTFTNFE